MPPTKKEQMALMAMMDDIIHSNLPPCPPGCPGCSMGNKACQSLTKHLSEIKESLKSAPSPSLKTVAMAHQHICHDHKCDDHRDIKLPPKKAPPPPKEKPKSPAPKTTPGTKEDKTTALAEAETLKDILDVLNLTKPIGPENEFSVQMQTALADAKTYTDIRAKLLGLSQKINVSRDALVGLLAKYRYDRGLLSSALLKANNEREKYSLAIKRVDFLMYELQNVAKGDKNSKGDEVRSNLSNIILEIHELASAPCAIYEEMLSIKEENDDLYAENEDTRREFDEFKSCHDKLHEKHKKLEADKTELTRQLGEARKKVNTISGFKNDANNLRKTLDKSRDENADLRKEVEKLTAELSKVNSLKHENAQLKKKLADALKEEAKPEVKAASKPEKEPVEAAPSNRKKKAKASAESNATPESAQNTPSNPPPKIEYRPDPMTLKQLESLRTKHEATIRESDTAKANLRQLEVLLQKSEVAKSHAIEQQNLERATSQNWKELSEGHKDECTRLQEQLDQSLSHASTLQDKIHQMEQATAELSEKLSVQLDKRSSSPSIESQTSAPSKFDADGMRSIRKVRAETLQLIRDLDESCAYHQNVEPWHVVVSTRRIVAGIDSELDEMLRIRGISEPSQETFLPFRYGEGGLLTPSTTRTQDRSASSTPNIPVAPPQMPPYRPMPPPGLSSAPFGRIPSGSNAAALPTPIGTGRPGNGQAKALTPSPTVTPVTPLTGKTNASKVIGNGAAGVDWSMWAKN